MSASDATAPATPARRSALYSSYGKRALDIAGSALALTALAPALGIIALCVRSEDNGPALFRQERVGRDGAPFQIYKFRSMPIDTKNVPSDQLGTVRITRVGRVIRRTNLDELPQLVNVLRGDMSLVGPRPALPAQSDVLFARHASGASQLRPGLTGLAQVSSYDGMSALEKAKFDGRYAAEMSLLTDLAIIGRTFGYLLKPPPTY